MKSSFSHQFGWVTIVGGFVLLIVYFAVVTGLVSVDETGTDFFQIFLILYLFLGVVFNGLVGLFERHKNASKELAQTTDAIEQSETTAMDLRDDGDDAVSDAIEAREAGNLSDAVDYYTEAIELYYTAAEMVDDSEKKEEIEKTIQRFRTDRSEVEAFQDSRESLVQTLQAGEENLQTAIVAHSQGERTLSRIRYRQARDMFANAIDELKANETELLQTPVHVSVTSDVSLPSQQLESISWIDDDMKEKLESTGVTTVDDLHQKADSVPEPLVSLGVDREDFNNDETAARLAALCWWCEDTVHTFHDSDDISQRHKIAVAGFQTT